VPGTPPPDRGQASSYDLKKKTTEPAGVAWSICTQRRKKREGSKDRSRGAKVIKGRKKVGAGVNEQGKRLALKEDITRGVEGQEELEYRGSSFFVGKHPTRWGASTDTNALGPLKENRHGWKKRNLSHLGQATGDFRWGSGRRQTDVINPTKGEQNGGEKRKNDHKKARRSEKEE